jgi:hypothetical protein
MLPISSRRKMRLTQRRGREAGSYEKRNFLNFAAPSSNPAQLRLKE